MTEEQVLSNLLNYGALGIFVVFLIWLLVQERNRSDNLMQRLISCHEEQTRVPLAFHRETIQSDTRPVTVPVGERERWTRINMKDVSMTDPPASG